MMPLNNDTIAIIGCGTMGEATVRGLIRRELVAPDNIVGAHPRAERRADLVEAYGIRCEANSRDAVSEAGVVVLAVKPQIVTEVMASLNGGLVDDALVISFVAGVSIAAIERGLGVCRVVRVMPNTPGQIGRGISVWTAGAGVADQGRERVKALLSALGTDEFVTHENELDMATALSGTGPAYAFLFMEALIDAGVHMGFSRRVASRLVFETLAGAVEFAAQSPDHLATLRNEVTSPGGTTAEACYHLERGRLRTVVSDAVWAAFRRSEQLGRQEPSEEAKGDG
ncbi:MAG: pyrroline-5-carboxylate reductase [Acidobacteria bacterium]|nr:MAG: pyrroline-5-carboxylate reductase [Acidobacteriota bacterium]